MIFTPGVPPDRARDDGSSAQDDDDGWMKKWVHNDDRWMDEKVHERKLSTLCSWMDG
jgi:hypothetical protein